MISHATNINEVRIADFCHTGSGGTPSRTVAEYFGGPIPWVKSGELRESIITATEENITQAGLENSAAKLLPKDTLLVALYGATVGRIGILGIEATTNQAVCHIIPNKGTADVRYLFYALQSKVDYWLNKRVGGGQPNISQGVIKDTVLHLPPLAEQKRIAEILDAADALRAKRREALTQLDALLQATFLDLFGDPVTNPKGWVLKTLEESGAKTKVGPFGSLLHVADYICDGIPLVNPKHMVEGQIVHGGDETVSEEKASELEDYRLKVGDLLVARRGEMGRCVIVRPEHSGWLCGTGSFYIRAHADAFLPEYLAACLSNQSMRRFLEHLSGGAIMPSLSGTQIKNLRISLPPMNEQVKFVRICQSISEHQSQQSAHLAELDVLFASLQSRAFRGEL